MATEATQESTYGEFIGKVKRISNVGSAAGVLGWDQEVMMPEGGTPARAQQLSALSALSHELLTDERMGELLDELESEDLGEEQAAVVREVRRDYERATRVPTDLVEEISRTTSEALPKWKEARENDDFSTFAPVLEKLVDLKREYAEAIDPDADPYEVLFADYEPYLDLETAEETLDRLREELVPLIEQVRESDAELATPFEGTFDVETQEQVSRDVLDTLGYDWDRGRLDTAPHPFSTGNQFDARVTTRFDEADPLGAITSTIHEFGHATYTLGLPDEHYGTPLGESRDLTVHESQSRLWENHVGRSRAFWTRFLPLLQERFEGLSDATVEDSVASETQRADGVTAVDVYEAANTVKEDNLIRVEADELTYHMHIVVRFEIERELISGDLAIEDVPEAWNDKYEEYLGIRPDTDSEGCLQDIHWSHGSFGYFPTYSLGSVLAAQLYDSATADVPDLEDQIEDGEFDDLHAWLTEHVHQYGARYTTDDLVQKATGESFTPDYFLDYVTEKYSDLYDL